MGSNYRAIMTPPITKLSKGTILISTPEINDGLFCRSVIFICEHNMNGSFGLIINKKVNVAFSEDLFPLKNLENGIFKICAGGPVHTHQLMVLHNCSEHPEQTLNIIDDIYLGGDLDFIQSLIHDSEREHNMCLCFGYAGWSPGQLEREILEGQWYVGPLQRELLFSKDYSTLWQESLLKMGGKYASISMIPEDLSLN